MKRTISPKEIDAIFEDATDQADACVKIYTLAFPNWDEIESIDGWPSVGEELHKYIFKKFIEFDSKHHPGVMAGGLWMNKGFSSLDKTVGAWEVDASKCKIALVEATVNNSQQTGGCHVESR